MTIYEHGEYDYPKKIVVDLSGPDGNAWAIMGICSKLAKKENLDFKPIQEEMMSGDYEHLLEVADKYFGDLIDFVK